MSLQIDIFLLHKVFTEYCHLLYFNRLDILKYLLMRSSIYKYPGILFINIYTKQFKFEKQVNHLVFLNNSKRENLNCRGGLCENKTSEY